MSRPVQVELIPGVTRVRHEDPEVAAIGYVGTFVGFHPANEQFMLVDCDDGDAISVYAAYWLVDDEEADA